MPIPNEIASAAATFRQNGVMLNKGFASLTPEEWLRRPNECSNHLLWIMGHVIWARGVMLGFLGSPWSRPWLPLFARGTKVVEAEKYPSVQELEEAWQEVSVALKGAFDQISETALSADAPGKAPSFDGKLSGTVGFLAFHEAYHVGQVAYLRCWLGHEGIAG